MNITRVLGTRFSLTALSALTVGCLLSGLTLSQAHAGTITVIRVMDGEPRKECTMDVPEAGSGVTRRLELFDRGSAGTGACYGIRPTHIEMKDIPSSAEILLTDDWLCDTEIGSTYYRYDDPSPNQNFVLKIETTRMPSQLAEIPIERLNSIQEGKYITFEDFKEGSFVGMKMISKVNNNAGAIDSKLSCIQITLSDDINTPTPATAALGSMTTHTMRESRTDFNCPAGELIVARKHKGGEQSDTTYTCQAVMPQAGKNVLFKQNYESVRFPECGRSKPRDFDDEPYDGHCERTNNRNDFGYFTCPPDTVMTGRWHEGDENGDTAYRCSTLYQDNETDANKFTVIPDNWADWMEEESDADFTCPTGKVMIGRGHHSDENGYTVYRCGTLFYPADTKAQVTP